MSDHYLEIPYFKEDSCLASVTVVIALGTGVRGEGRELFRVKCQQQNENLLNVLVC